MLRGHSMLSLVVFALAAVSVTSWVAATFFGGSKPVGSQRSESSEEPPPTPSFKGEPRLQITPAQELAFMGALVALGRADGALSGPELDVLRAVAAHHGFALHEEALMSEDHDPERALELVRTVAATPFRHAATSPPAEVARGFLVAARRLAAADGTFDARRDELLERFERVFG